MRSWPPTSIGKWQSSTAASKGPRSSCSLPGPYDHSKRHPRRPCRDRRRGQPGLDADAAAHVPALGRRTTSSRLKLVDQSEGEEAGIKSATVGDHRQGRLWPVGRASAACIAWFGCSPFDQAHRRHTSFALVEEVLPEIEDDSVVEIDPKRPAH